MNIDVKGRKYHVETKGQGFPVVLLHGFTGDTTTWLETEEYLENEVKLIKVDLLGHGKSDTPEDISLYEMDSVIEDLRDILIHLDLKQVDLVGYSMGGRVALAFALSYPTTVRKLILESASPGLSSEEERAARRLQDRQLAERIEEKGLDWFVEYWENIPLFQSQLNLPFSIRQCIKEQRKQNSIKGLVNSLLGMGTGSQIPYWDELSGYTGEVLLVTGSVDTKFVNIADRMSQRLLNSQWVNIEGAGHAIHVELPEKFGTIVRGFLSNEPSSN